MNHEIELQAGMRVRLPTSGKYCDKDIVVTAKGAAAANPVIQPLEITENGTYTAPAGVDGYSPVIVNVAGSGGRNTVTITTKQMDSTMYYLDANMQERSGTSYSTAEALFGLVWFIDSEGALESSGTFTKIESLPNTNMYILHEDSTVEYW